MSGTGGEHLPGVIGREVWDFIEAITPAPYLFGDNVPNPVGWNSSCSDPLSLRRPIMARLFY